MAPPRSQQRGPIKQLYYFSSGDVTIDNQAYDYSYFYFGTGNATVHDSNGYAHYYHLSTGTFDIHTSGYGYYNFYADAAGELQAGDVIEIGAGAYGSSLSLSGATGTVYDLDGVSITGVQTLSLNGVILEADTATLAGFSSINGSGSAELRTDDTSLDLSGKSVAAGVAITSSNATGTTFTVTDAQTALDVIGGTGNDTLDASGITLTEAQRFDIFNQGSVEVITDLSGTYTGPAVSHLTPGTDTISLVSGNNAVVGNAAALNAPDQLTGGSDYDALALYNAGSFDLRTLAAFTGFEEVDLIDNTAGGQTATLYTPDGQNLLVAVRGNNDAVIWGGDGNETVNLAGGGYSEFHLGDGTNTVSNSRWQFQHLFRRWHRHRHQNRRRLFKYLPPLQWHRRDHRSGILWQLLLYLSSGDVTINNQAYD